MNNKFLIPFLILALIISLRLVFSYRIIPFPNSGDLKYKEGKVIYFPHFTFINPFKKQTLLSKIKEYHNAEIFIKGNKANEVVFFDYFKEKSKTNDLEIVSLKLDEYTYLILVTVKDNDNAEIVYILDKETDKIIGVK